MSLSVFTKNIADKEISFSTGELAKQTNGSVLVQTGGTVVLVTACMAKSPREGIDFFPLLVDYQEKTYAAGRIPGGFFKREGRPKEGEILIARIVDRSIRPLFPDCLRNDVQLVCTVLSSDGENDPDVLAVNGASFALSISDIPFNTPIGACRVIRSDGKFIVNPTYAQRENISLDVFVSASSDKILMIESKANNESEEIAMEAIKLAHKYVKEFIALQNEAVKSIGKDKQKVNEPAENLELNNKVISVIKDKLDKLYDYSLKENPAKEKELIVAELKTVFEDAGELSQALDILAKEEKKYIRSRILESKVRPDGRSVDQIRNIDCKVGVLPRTHGSALFTRGQTQSLSVITLGTAQDMQIVESLEGETSKRFMLHYTFPGFSVGEVSPLRSPSRREIGHGALAEKSLEVVIPSESKFPYTIRLVSEILESNGSSSMATVCAGTLSLMDAGVPISDPVAGIAMGLICEKEKYLVLTDIAGVEDHYGDMDFKVAGTRKGVTAIQLDLKIDGIGYELIEHTLEKAKVARNFILDKMQQAIDAPRRDTSEFAPKIKTFAINPEKIGELIGPGGKNIKRIIKDTGASIDIDDEQNIVMISSSSTDSMRKAEELVRQIIDDLEVGKIYEAKVKKITNFGAFCDVAPGKGGLLHISELSSDYVKDVSSCLHEGDMIKVKVISIDEQGRVNFSKKQVDEGKDK